ncbi:MAG: antitoxin VapB family protein [Desulfurococcaceae archaeon TW002]
MDVKIITISLEAYEALLRIKKPGESFSDVILKLTRKHKNLIDLASAWRNIENEKIEKILEEIRKTWFRWIT